MQLHAKPVSDQSDERQKQKRKKKTRIFRVHFQRVRASFIRLLFFIVLVRCAMQPKGNYRTKPSKCRHWEIWRSCFRCSNTQIFVDDCDCAKINADKNSDPSKHDSKIKMIRNFFFLFFTLTFSLDAIWSDNDRCHLVMQYFCVICSSASISILCECQWWCARRSLYGRQCTYERITVKWFNVKMAIRISNAKAQSNDGRLWFDGCASADVDFQFFGKWIFEMQSRQCILSPRTLFTNRVGRHHFFFFFLCARRDHRCHRMKCNNRTNGWQERQKCQCLWILFENGENDKLLFISSNHAIAVSRLKANRRHSDCIIFDIYSIPHRPQSETAQAREMSDARCISVIDGFRPKWITSKWYFCKRLHLCNPRDALRSRTCVCVCCVCLRELLSLIIFVRSRHRCRHRRCTVVIMANTCDSFKLGRTQFLSLFSFFFSRLKFSLSFQCLSKLHKKNAMNDWAVGHRQRNERSKHAAKTNVQKIRM